MLERPSVVGIAFDEYMATNPCKVGVGKRISIEYPNRQFNGPIITPCPCHVFPRPHTATHPNLLFWPQKRSKDRKSRDFNPNEAQRAKAREAFVLAERLEAIGLARDAAFNQAKALGAEFDDVMGKLRGLGAPAPSAELVEVNENRAMDSALVGLHREARPVPPSQRHSFVSLYSSWAGPALMGREDPRAGRDRQA